MNSKIALIYENKTFKLEVTGEMIKEFKNFEEAVKAYEEKIKEIDNSEEGKWNNLLSEVNRFKEDGLEVNNEFKSMEFKGLKYFLKTDKVFYMYNGEMIPLLGGFNFFKSTLALLKDDKIGNLESFILFLKEVIISKVNYRLNELSLLVLSASFNYGSAEYNFQTGKLNKGASIEDFTFGEFKNYVLQTIKRR
ncbi:hypothetical protein [Clostridium thermobutyricum]|uniref:hypothetical protein n=1 Tax=Clostridium thermobutyricum TaxID=29372 RepID=UPI002943D6BD|nr:hypothetical protein [Clostridium thermobutyricum]